MKWLRKTLVLLGLAVLAPLAVRRLAHSADQAAAKPTRFTFQVVESFDAKYLGDTPGHIGRGGGLGPARPDVALGTLVSRGEERVGKVTRLTWDRAKESLEVEF